MRPRRIVLSVFLLCFLAVLLNICFYKLQRTLKFYHSRTASSDKSQAKIGSYPSGKNKDENGRRSIEALRSNRRQYNTLFKGCAARKCKDPSEMPTPFKIYVYDLPPYFNKDIQRFLTDSKKFSYCFNLDNCGMGEEMYQIDNQGRQVISRLHANGFQGLEDKGDTELNISALGTRSYFDIQSVRNTHQFALEVIIHCKLLHSPYRTMIPDEADFYYIPAYAGLNCISERNNNALFVHQLFDFMRTNENTSRYYNSGKPHFMTLSKIQREMAETGCPILHHPDASKITFITIEKETNPSWLQQKHIFGRSIVVAPYPSYIHYATTSENNAIFQNSTLSSNISLIHLPGLQTRKILLFLAASKRRSNPFRATILDQFRIKTSKSLKDFFLNNSKGAPNYIEQVMLMTNECSREHRSTTVLWMRSSTYCLQPPGDSSTRKSIYDSILSGCIPVLFKGQYKTEYPFQRVLDYDTFTYSIDNKQLTKDNRTVLEIVKDISPQRTKDLNHNLRKVAKWFQYSVPSGDIQWEKDALTMILDELAYKYRLKLGPTKT